MPTFKGRRNQRTSWVTVKKWPEMGVTASRRQSLDAKKIEVGIKYPREKFQFGYGYQKGIGILASTARECPTGSGSMCIENVKLNKTTLLTDVDTEGDLV